MNYLYYKFNWIKKPKFYYDLTFVNLSHVIQNSEWMEEQTFSCPSLLYYSFLAMFFIKSYETNWLKPYLSDRF